MKSTGWVWIGGGLLLLTMAGAGGYAVYRHYKQRGIRNNNPGNLVRTSIAWKGKVPHARNKDPRFEQFEDRDGIPGHIWGLRAMFMDLRGDIVKDGKNTLRRLIHEYAPAFENKTDRYIAAVAEEVGVNPDAPLQPDHYLPMLRAMVRVENGVQPYPTEDLQRAMALA